MMCTPKNSVIDLTIFGRRRITSKSIQDTSCRSIGNITDMATMSRRSSEGSIENQVMSHYYS